VAVVALWRWAWVMWLGLVAAPLGLNMGIVNYVDVSTLSYKYTAYPNARVGVGIYLVLVGALLIALGTALWVTRHHWTRPPLA
jgi:uncharacterized membrane protein YidH (DUF202 family)